MSLTHKARTHTHTHHALTKHTLTITRSRTHTLTHHVTHPQTMHSHTHTPCTHKAHTHTSCTHKVHEHDKSHVCSASRTRQAEAIVHIASGFANVPRQRHFENAKCDKQMQLTLAKAICLEQVTKPLTGHDGVCRNRVRMFYTSLLAQLPG